MYLWKCWLEYRRVTFVAVVLSFVLVCLGDYFLVSFPKLTTNAKGKTVVAERGLGRYHDPELQADALKEAEHLHSSMIIMFGLLAANFLGAVGGIAREYEERTTELLFTRPQRRRSLLWINCWSGVLAVETIALVPLVAWIVLTRTIGHGFLFQAMLLGLPMNILVFGISLFSGVLLHGAPKGSGVTFLVFLAYLIGTPWLRLQYGIQTPSWWFDKLYEGLPNGNGGSIPWNLYLLWMAIALVFPFLTQMILEHRDVI